MKRYIAFAFAMIMLAAFATTAVAATPVKRKPPADLVVESAVVATGVVGREPVGASATFPYDVERVYCHAKITGATNGEYVEHVWKWGDTEMARVPLSVKAKEWRTHSSKRMIRTWTGRWTVDIVAHGEVLKTVEFTIEEPKNKYNGK